MSAQKYASMVRMHLTLREQGWVPSETGTSALFNGGYAPFYCWTHPSRPWLNVETVEGVWFVNHGFDDGGPGEIVPTERATAACARRWVRWSPDRRNPC